MAKMLHFVDVDTIGPHWKDKFIRLGKALELRRNQNLMGGPEGRLPARSIGYVYAATAGGVCAVFGNDPTQPPQEGLPHALPNWKHRHAVSIAHEDWVRNGIMVSK